jgi:DNA mismatch endonuclease, patch repair protein
MSSLRTRAPIASSHVVRRVMQANTARETEPERVVRRFLRQRGLCFRKDQRPIPRLRCAADLVFRIARLCIFIDGCFWHGCPTHFRVPASNSMWWTEKIEANRVRDRRNNAILKHHKWCVIRVWEHQVNARYLAELESRIRRKIRTINC